MNNQMELSFLAVAQNEAFARMVISAFLVQTNPTLSVVSEVRTAVSEAVTNAIVHAYPNELGKISIKTRIYEGKVLEIVVRDWGRGIENIDQARQPLFTTGGEERSGMGFTIMESFMDKLTVRSVPGRGTTVTMRKKISVRLSDRL